jgi:hypothetical protein
MGIHSFVAPIVRRGLHPMMSFRMPLHPLSKREAWFHVLWEQTHVFPPHFLQFFCQWINIVLFRWCHYYWLHLNKLGIMNNFFSWGGYDSGGLGEGKILSWLLPNGCGFFLLLIFGCIHMQFDNFLHRRANMAWTTKDTKGLPLSILYSLYK